MEAHVGGAWPPSFLPVSCVVSLLTSLPHFLRPSLTPFCQIITVSQPANKHGASASLPAPSMLIFSMPLTSRTTSSLPVLAHERATSPLFQASAFAFRSFPLLLRLPLAFAPSGNKRHHHHHARSAWGRASAPTSARRAVARNAGDRRYASMTAKGAGARISAIPRILCTCSFGGYARICQKASVQRPLR